MKLSSAATLLALLLCMILAVVSSAYEEDEDFVDEQDFVDDHYEHRDLHWWKRNKLRGSRYNVTNETLALCDTVACGFRGTNETGVIACREDSPWPWFGHNTADDGTNKTVCASKERHLETDVCGPCSGDSIPSACTACPCTITRGRLMGESGYYIQKIASNNDNRRNLHFKNGHKMHSNENKTFCMTEAQTITKQLYGGDRYVCPEIEDCPIEE